MFKPGDEIILDPEFIRKHKELRDRILVPWMWEGLEGTVLTVNRNWGTQEGVWVGRNGVHALVHPYNIQYSSTQLDKFKAEMEGMLVDV